MACNCLIPLWKDSPGSTGKLSVMSSVSSQKYMDSTLTVYRRTYNRIHIFLNHHGTDIYTHELGKAFLADSNVSKSTFVAYACAVRRLDDYIDGKPYRYHHGDYDEQIPLVFADTLSGYLQECIDNGNKPALYHRPCLHSPTRMPMHVSVSS